MRLDEPNPEGFSLAGALFNLPETKFGKNNSIKKNVKFNGKSNSNQFSLLNFYSMSTRSNVLVDFVLELAWAGVWAWQYLNKTD